MELPPEGLRRFGETVGPVLDERPRRLIAGASSEAVGCGGTTWVIEASGLSRNTVIDGRRETESGVIPTAGRVRARGQDGVSA